MAIDRKVLKQMCFVRGRGFDHEVWYHYSDCWVHYGSGQEFEKYAAYGSNWVRLNGDTDSMEHFFAEFIENAAAGARMSAEEYSEDW